MTPDDRRCLVVLVAALALAGLAHLIRLPWWVALWCVALWGLAIYRSRSGLGPVGRSLRFGLTALGLTAAALTWRLVPGVHLGLVLLSVMIGLKPLEIQSHRDRVMTVFLTYFVIACALLYNDSMLVAVYLPAAAVMATAALALSGHPGLGWRRSLSAALRLGGLALPAAIVVFLLFPRFEGQLWGKTFSTRGMSGFSERLQPGSLSSVGLNRQVVFRAVFQDDLPPVHQRYWRGIVFHRFDGRQWVRAPLPPVSAKPLQGTGAFTHRITLEPTGRQWLFALDVPAVGPPNTWKMTDNTLVARRPVHQRVSYEVTSVTTPSPVALAAWEKTHSELVVLDSNPRASALAAQWAATAEDRQALIDRALNHFKTQGFTYSLEADTVDNAPIDHFLFNSRRGYCEHFATAFCFLMRAAGIPARVVGGYLGGEFNPFGNYLIVRESDAHVWVEVWLEDQGWQRVDPTYQVDPGRVEQGVAATLAGQGRGAGNRLLFGGPIATLRLGWDALEIHWGRHILGYSADHQRRLRDLLGRHRIAGAILLAAGCLVLAVFVKMGRLGPRNRGLTRRLDPVKAAHDRFCAKLERSGVHCHPAEGPRDLSRRLSRENPALAGPAAEILTLYTRLRYGLKTGPAELGLLQDKVRRFGR